jgi:hypothetical protein
VHSLEINHADNPWSLDLHVTLDRGYPGIVIKFGADDLIADCGLRIADATTAQRELNRAWQGHEAQHNPQSAIRNPHLPHPLKLAYLAAHTSQDFTTMQLVRLVELVLVIRRDFQNRPGRWEEFGAFVASRGLERFVYPSLELAGRLVPGTLPQVARQRLLAGVPARLRRLVERTDLETLIRFRARWIVWRLMWSSSPGDYLRDLGHALWPRVADGPIGFRRFVSHQSHRFWRVIARAVNLLA